MFLLPLPLRPGLKELRANPGEGHSQNQAELTTPHPLPTQRSSSGVSLQPEGWGGCCCMPHSLGGGFRHLPWLCSSPLLVQAPALALLAWQA